MAQLPGVFEAISFSSPVQGSEDPALKEGLEFQDDVEFSLAEDTVGPAEVAEKSASSPQPGLRGGILVGHREKVNGKDLIEIGIAAQDILKGILDQPGDMGSGIFLLHGLQRRKGEDQIPQGAQTDEKDLCVVQISAIMPHVLPAVAPSRERGPFLF